MSLDEESLFWSSLALTIAAGEYRGCSYIQRRIGIGFNLAAKFVERMEDSGVLSTASSTGKRQLLISDFREAQAAVAQHEGLAG